MTQYARPDGEVSASNWDSHDYTDINESSPDDGSSYAVGNNENNGTWIITLDNTISSPGAGTCTLRARARKSTSGGFTRGLTAVLKEGTTTIATAANADLSESWGTFTDTFDRGEIGDWSNLTVELATSGDTGTPAPNRRYVWLTWVELEAPDGAGGGSQSMDGTVSPEGAAAKSAGLHRTGSGSHTPGGALAKTAGLHRQAAGGVTPSGALASVLQAVKQLSGSITPDGTLAMKLIHRVGGAMAPVGSLAKKVWVKASGAIAPAGIGQTVSAQNEPVGGALAAITGLLRWKLKQIVSGSLGLAGSVSETVYTLEGLAAGLIYGPAANGSCCRGAIRSGIAGPDTDGRIYGLG